jgi:hypothetical protein
MDRRDFVRVSVPAALAVAMGLAWPARLGAAGTGPGAGDVPPPGDGARRMGELLRKITREADPMKNPYRSSEQVDLLRPLVAQATDLRRLFGLRTQLAEQLLLAGQPDEALAEFGRIDQMVAENSIPLDEPMRDELTMKRAMCFLRMGEQENCGKGHNADSCMFPIHGGGIHTKVRGSRGAIEILTGLLERTPGDLRARWLLNIAYMTLGEYPGKVPARWLLEPSLFDSQDDIGHFPDIAGSVGLDIDGLAGGVVLEDFDNDGFLDVMVSSWGLDRQLRLFRNNGDGTFTERTQEAGLTGELGGLNLVSCDYNNDGNIDVLVLRGAWLGPEGHYPVSLLRNNGDGTFSDVTVEAGLLRFRPTGTATWFDYNGDGWIDLFIGNESQGPDKVPCELFRNNGDGTFTECAAEHGLDVVGFVKGVASADYNNDGRPDLFVSRLDGPPLLFRNDGPAGADASARARWRFTEVGEAAGITHPLRSFPCWFFDYDNDGWADLFVTGYGIQDVGDIAADYMGRPHSGQLARLYRNNRDGTFTDVSRECGVNKLLHTMGCNYGDLDNDGWLDFYVGTGDPDLATIIPNRMFRNDGGRRFLDVTTSGGFGQLQKGHGVAFGDINNSGTQDIYSVVGGAVEGDDYRHQLFANPGHGNHWVKLKLEGVRSNRAAMGARITLVVRGPDGERAIHRTVGSGGSFGASPMRQEIGIGKATSILRAEIFWPATGATQVVTGLAANRMYRIREGSAVPEPVALRSFEWPRPA